MQKILAFLSITTLLAAEPIVLTKPERTLMENIKRALTFTTYVEKTTSNFSIPGIVGSIPQELVIIIDQLINQIENVNLNRLLLYGPPGNGKSTIAKKMATLIDAHFIYQAAPSIVSKYIGSAAENIGDRFDEALSLIKETGKPVLIFIDEIDAIANDYKSKSEFRSEHENALKQLWLCMDQHKDNKDIFIVCATNEFKMINKTFLDRFGSNTIEIGNPDKDNRKIILEHYFGQHDITLEPKFLEYLVKQSKGLSTRALEDLVKAAVQDKEKLTSERVELLMQKSKEKKEKRKGSAEEHASIIAAAVTTINSVLHVPILSYQLYSIVKLSMNSQTNLSLTNLANLAKQLSNSHPDQTK